MSLICPVCFWEDDAFVGNIIDEPSLCNHQMTLRQARANFALLGACERKMIRNVVAESERSQFAQGPLSPDS